MFIDIKLSRDSVCAGDDIDDHTQIVRIDNSRDPITEIMVIAKDYLAMIAGRGHSWDCYLNGEKVAQIKGNCVSINQLSKDITLTNEDKLYFKYNSATF